MRKLLILLALLLVFMCAVFGVTTTGGNGGGWGQPTATPPPPGGSAIRAIKADLSVWGEGRWQNWDAVYDRQNHLIIMRVAADPAANDTAINSYCDKLGELSARHAPGYNWQGRIYILGDVVKICP